MKKLEIQLNQVFKSFPNGFKTTLEGGLIILSGVNGSGKSQLMDVISQRDSYGNREIISASVTLDGTKIEHTDILLRSFKQNINIPDLTHAGTQTVNSHKGQVWNAYYSYILDYNRKELWDYKESCVKAKKILLDHFGAEKFNNKKIEQQELQSTIPSDFVWKSSDVFTNSIGELFYNHALNVYHINSEIGQKALAGEKFEKPTLTEAPWKQLNDLFGLLSLEYRFKDNYFLDRLEINEQPSLYQVNTGGTIDPSKKRKLADLSDGEKAIISLAFAPLSGTQEQDKKILLLDEYDANFNPSLTNAFYTILNRYFVEKGVVVIIATHSPTTISLAPDVASFYEVFKENSTLSGRILPVQKDDYAELEVANKSFYAKISDQASRINELEQEKEGLANGISELKAQTKPFLFVEGDIDDQYLKKVVEFYPDWKIILDRVEMKEKGGAGNLFKYWKNRSNIKEFLKQPVILLFDYDTNRSNEDDAPIYKRCVPIEHPHSVKVGIENLLPDELIKKAEAKTGKKFTKKSTPDSDMPDIQVWEIIEDKKKDLSVWICANAVAEDFSKFDRVFSQINAILPPIEIEQAEQVTEQ